MFFSVKSTLRIAGKVYTPCVCYPLPENLVATVDKLVAEEKAYKFEDRVYFQNGKVLVKKSVVEETSPAEKPKKAKKEKTVPVADTVEEVPSPEEVADNLGGF